MAVLGPDADLTERILGCAFRVLAVLDCGFLEKVYENALLHELRKSGLAAESQRPIQVHYDGVPEETTSRTFWSKGGSSSNSKPPGVSKAFTSRRPSTTSRPAA
jgi:hypothetical protein